MNFSIFNYLCLKIKKNVVCIHGCDGTSFSLGDCLKGLTTLTLLYMEYREISAKLSNTTNQVVFLIMFETIDIHNTYVILDQIGDQMKGFNRNYLVLV